MYYYAYIDLDTGFCYDVVESDVPIDDPSYIELSGFSDYIDYYKYYRIRKTYVNGEWRDTTVEEAERYNAPTVGEQITIGNEWLDVVLDGKAPLDHTHEGYATSDHVHTGYVSSGDLQALEDTINAKADSTHTHSEYANVNHSHDGYATQTALDTLGEEVEGKADVGHSHTEYVTTTDFETLESEVDGKASSTHTHTASEIGAATSGHNHDSEYADITHDHDEDYAPLSHSHTNYATTTDFDALEAEVEGIEEITSQYITNLFSATN